MYYLLLWCIGYFIIYVVSWIFKIFFKMPPNIGDKNVQICLSFFRCIYLSCMLYSVCHFFVFPLYFKFSLSFIYFENGVYVAESTKLLIIFLSQKPLHLSAIAFICRWNHSQYSSILLTRFARKQFKCKCRTYIQAAFWSGTNIAIDKRYRGDWIGKKLCL